ncbi:exodeoxyribonuclease VII large subunit [Suttonella sp. R2A3]|uniref:exodeoxyribonuclease VII large subunit n=1 Tax=Suttonella sp. R2A3 TaxID=2908648 RepID=UPI001F48D3AC|nr:exodeoxyribonuclease VII large subunit [Suttonella sp. R2A3]UJF23905.1 exodeoxyribonuclease VII large subunit [Suttonella sp. R2A3]
MSTTFSVSELNRQVRSELELSFGDVWVEGELSNLARPASGHLYFSLKDSSAQISCALFKGSRFGLKIPLAEIDNGIAVRAHGRVSLYEPRGNYQLIIDQLEPAGVGALEQAFKARQAQLAAEGLFAAELKQAIPTHPRAIGIITSASGAALHDALTTLKRRHPFIPVIIYPSLVQGERAAPQLMTQIETANRRQECDTLLLIRGGGSLEDLWAFNDPDLVRAIVASKLPIISGVGHEIDVTLSDFAADLRAPTPTAAAEQAIPALAETLARQQQRLSHVNQRVQRIISQYQQQVLHLGHRLSQQNPTRRVQQHSQRCDELSARLQRNMTTRLTQQRQRVAQIQSRLSLVPLHRRHQRETQHISELQQRLQQGVVREQQRHMSRLERLAGNLNALSPLNVLARGYAMAFDEQRQMIRHSDDVGAGARIHVRLNQGILHCDVVRRSKKP